VFRLTGSGLGVSGVIVAEILPVLLLSPVAGVVADRLPRVRLMIAADLWRMTLAGCCRWSTSTWPPSTRWRSGWRPARWP
jgi:hypothetical protein